MKSKIINKDCLEGLKELQDESIDCCITSPPYYGLRDYGIYGQLGLEKTPEEYVNKLIEVFREVRRVLKKNGTLWLNLGDSYGGSGMGLSYSGFTRGTNSCDTRPLNIRPAIGHQRGKYDKQIMGIPWRVAFALQADGWRLRQDIIWCLSGGTYLYAKTQKGVRPMMIRDLARLNPNTIQLWSGKKWVNVLGMSKSKRKDNELELVLRSGERISCTPNHKFPTKRGCIEALDLKIGDVIETTQLPDTNNPKDCALDEDAAWFAGIYIAEGSHADDCIQIAGHVKENGIWEKLQKIAKKYGGYITRTIYGNCMNIRLYGKVLNAILDEIVSGRTAKDKCFAPIVWNYSNKFIASMVNGYLTGDGHWDSKNNRWRLGFTRNYNLERDLRTASARLGYKIILNLSSVKYRDKQRPTFKGEIRKEWSKHFNNKYPSEVVKIKNARCREIYDIGLENEPHLFALVSGILTHNSKPNPMPESVIDRCTKAHEYIFLLSKNPKYYYDYKSILEPANYDGRKATKMKGGIKYQNNFVSANGNIDSIHIREQERWPRTIGRTECKMKNTSYGGDGKGLHGHSGYYDKDGNPRFHQFENGQPARNKRSVWTVPTKPYKGAHFATFPPDLITPCILAGCEEEGTVLDPFFGAGTVGIVCKLLNRNYIGIELNSKYVSMAQQRIANIQNPLFLLKK